jgi:hypothetical protein
LSPDQAPQFHSRGASCIERCQRENRPMATRESAHDLLKRLCHENSRLQAKCPRTPRRLD